MSLRYKGQKRNASRSFCQQRRSKRWGLKSLLSRILTRFPSPHGKELSLKYADTLNDWIELPADDLDSFVNKFLLSKETVVLRRWERSKQKFGFIKRVDKRDITTVKDLES